MSRPGSHCRRIGWAPALAGCSGSQSALEPHGPAAQDIAELFWGMTLGGTLIFAAFMALALYAAFRARSHSVRFARRLIVGGAVVFPTVLLGGLLVYGLMMLPGQLAPAPGGSLRIHVAGHQWWWRVRYEPKNGAPFETANELYLPVGETVQLELSSPDVIHSFWIPSLAGKVDMIPGRKTRLALRATHAGVYRGACAEYCGTSHAWMAFMVKAVEKDEFAAWLRKEAGAASSTAIGQASFMENGCGACHAVRGTSARGTIGPDLTHVGNRQTIGAGRFMRSAATFEQWLSATDKVKPGVHMPSFGMLPTSTRREIARYLESLK